ncbi:hypothetical protein CP965_06995 [Halarcobacter mediterraneus]|uniref:OmpA-like domain-containing protein n=1 Tax=Halarcobacter mediterraneus TaxID=2023153 RepID=A0A4V1M1G1_9BACT|nr:ankyrin repeat domain-containing protein [Halarcobacter mediterraneus]RXK13544.1 hypothetical protein CP965_06995 [Halarcobacter mediterraneus]
MKNYIVILITLFFIGCAKQNSLQKESSFVSEPLHNAVRSNNKELVNSLIKENKELLNKKDRFGYTPLHLASRFNHLEIVKLLIDSGAEVNTQDKYGDTPLIDATKNNFTSISKLLVCNKADVLVEDKYGKKALDYAQKLNNVYISKLIKADNSEYLCNPTKVKYHDLIAIDNYNTIIESNPTICGNILDSSVSRVQASFDGGETILEGQLYKDEKRWCVKNYRKLLNGKYLLAVMAINKKGQKALVKKTIKIDKKISLATRLNNEFKDDLKKWNAEILDNELIFRFKNPSLLFERGSTNLNPTFKNILDKFIPKYINIVKDYKENISLVSIDGHTSSKYKSARTFEEKFEKNRLLSQKRADSVYDYIISIVNKDDKTFIKDNFIAKGLSSKKLILNKDGSENVELSRRVEFKIEK